MSQHDAKACEQVPSSGPEELYGDEVYHLNTTRRRDPELRYFELWDNVFRGHPRPASPYLRPGWAEPLRVLCERLRPWLQEQMPSLIHDYHDANARGEDAVQLFTGNLMDVIDHVPTQSPRYRRAPPTPPPLDEAGPAGPPTADNGGDGAQAPEADLVGPPNTLPINQPTSPNWTTNPQNPEEGPAQPNYPAYAYPEMDHANYPAAPVNAGEPELPIHLSSPLLGTHYVSPTSHTNVLGFNPNEVLWTYDTLQEFNGADTELDDSMFDSFFDSNGVPSHQQDG